MRKFIFILLSFYCLLAGDLYAQNFKGKPEEKVTIADPESAMRVGEAFWYSVEWLGVPVGHVYLGVKEIIKIDGHDCYHVVAKTYPNSFLKRFVDLEYNVDTFIDTKELFSRRFEKYRRLDDQVNHTLINFFQEKGEVEYKSEGSSKAFVIAQRQEVAPSLFTNKIPLGTQDLLSSLYYFRLAKIQEDTKYHTNIYYHQVNWDVEFSVTSPTLKDLHKKGTFPIFKVFPTSGLNDFILGKHNFTIFFTADARRIPVEFRFSTGIGSIRAIIKDIPD